MRVFIIRLFASRLLFLLAALSLPWLLGSPAYAATYTWLGAGGNTNWSNANNWDPARVPAADDVLLFDGSKTATVNVTVDFSMPQTISQLRFINNVSAVLTVQPNLVATALPPARQLTFATSLTGANLEITAGSFVQVKSPDGAGSTAGMTFSLGSEGTALVAGTLVFGSNSTASLTNDPHQLISLKRGVNTIQFISGSTFRADKTLTGFPFNDRAESSGTVAFRSGSTYDHRGGSAPFGTSLPTAPVTVFEKGNRYIYTVTSTAAGPQLSGRTYGFLEYNRATTATGVVGGTSTITSSSLPLTILDDLTIMTGNVRLNVANVNIQGNLMMNGGALVNTLGASTMTFNGSTPQLITSAGAPIIPVSFGGDVSIVVNNPAGVTLQTPVQVNKVLTLTSGRVLATTAGPLTLAAGATTTTQENSFVAGPFTRIVAASGTTTLDFPVGLGTAYRPITLTVNHSDATEVRYTAEQFKGKPLTRTLTGDIKKVSAVQHFIVNRSSTAANFINGYIKLTYGPEDQVDNLEKLRIAKSSSNNQAWDDLGGVATGMPAGTITSTIPFTGFSTFVLASTDASSQSGSNPLPVELMSFSAVPKAQGVLIQWATASEKDNAGFEVERAYDGHNFTTVAKASGAGQSTQKQVYSAIDATPLHAAATYYRLKMVDFEGGTTYSRVVAVKGSVNAETYPNPASNQLTVRLPYTELTPYYIRTATGKIVMQGKAAASLTTLNISALPDGIYYLEYKASDGRAIHKFIKQTN